MPIEQGTVAELTWSLGDSTAAVTLQLTRPDGQTSAPTVTFDGGLARAIFVAAIAGRWVARWSQTGGAVYTDVADVWPQDPRFLISLSEAKAAIGAANANVRGVPAFPADQEQELRLYIAAATPVIEDITGPLLLRNESFTTRGGQTALALPHLNVQVVFVTSANEPVEFHADAAAGLLWGGTRQNPTSLPPGQITVSYTVGGTLIPPNLVLATRELLRHWWQIGKNSLRGNATLDATGEAFTPSGFAVPRRVIELCTPNEEIGGFA